MTNYLFLLGKALPLCEAELLWALSHKNLNQKMLTPALREISMDEQYLEEFTNTLGGIVKVAKVLSREVINPLENIITDLLAHEGKVQFCIHGSSEKNANTIVKNALKDADRASRFLETDTIYDTAMSMQKNYHEYWIVPFDGKMIVAKCVWMQDIKIWAKKDFGRPKSDPRSGMLPPKIARILVNLALRPEVKNARVYDPFCGSGTLLMEALSLGQEAIGSDLSLKAVEDTEDNLAWFKETMSPDARFTIFQADAVQVSTVHTHGLVDAIVFEPFMGPPRIRPEKIKDIAKGLEKLYIGTLKNLSHLLPKGGRLVCILPTLKADRIVKRTDSLIDRCENFGYTLENGPLEYSRPQASVVRQIYVLEKN